MSDFHHDLENPSLPELPPDGRSAPTDAEVDQLLNEEWMVQILHENDPADPGNGPAPDSAPAEGPQQGCACDSPQEDYFAGEFGNAPPPEGQFPPDDESFSPPADSSSNPVLPGDWPENPADPGDWPENPADPGAAGFDPATPEGGLPPEGPEDQQNKPDKKEPRKHLYWWQKRKKRRTPFLVRLTIYGAVVLLVGIAIGMFVWECAQDVLALGHKDGEVTVVVTKEDTIDTITEKLYSKNLISHKWLFRLYCDLSHAEEKIDPGVYRLNSLYDYHALVYGMIANSGTRATATIMIPEGYDCEQIFALLERNNICSAQELRETAASYAFDYWFLQDIPMGETNRLEGYLYPDTYEFYISDAPENVLSKILRNFDRKIDEDMQALIQESGMTLHEIINIASMIEEEAANDDERADVSAVLHNRLKADNYLRYLQMDSTVFYACRQQGGFDIGIDSPYNTYVYPGLPAGPIDNPGMQSIMAALQPSQTDYTYFATGVDGLNHFFNNYDEFTEFVNSDQYIGNGSR